MSNSPTRTGVSGGLDGPPSADRYAAAQVTAHARLDRDHGAGVEACRSRIDREIGAHRPSEKPICGPWFTRQRTALSGP